MQKAFVIIPLFFCLNSFSQDRFQLARPLAKYESLFFKGSAKLELWFAQPGAKIYYTIDNKMPFENSGDPTEKDLLYKKPFIFKDPFTTIRAKIFCKGYMPSETVEFSFAKEGKKIKKITSTAPNFKYPGNGDSTLFDNKGGIENSSSKTWMGFDGDTISFNIELARKETIKTVLLSFLRNEDSWIFLPELILVYYFDESKNAFVPFGREVIFNEERSHNNVNFRFIFPTLDNIKTQKLLIDLMPVKKIPDWHPAKGQHAWCFIDEIKVY
jgi:hypothetical protein